MQTIFKLCPITLMTFASDNYVRIRIDLPSMALCGETIILQPLTVSFEHEKSSSCHQRNKQAALPLRNIFCLEVPQSFQSFVELTASGNVKNRTEKWPYSETPALYLCCCGYWLLRSSTRLKEIIQFLRIRLR